MINKTLPIFKKTSFIILLSIFCHGIGQAQSNDLSKNSIYVDAGFIPGVHAFINYERSVCQGKKVSWYGRVGYGYGGILLHDGGTGALGAITMLTGKKNSHFELNAGVFSGKGDDDSITLPLLDVGYRYQKPSGGFIFKAKAGVLGIGIGLGYAF